MQRSRLAVTTGVLLAVAAGGCATLEPAGTCGNRVVELALGEDCDGPGPACNATCRFACLDDGTCSEPGQVCGVDRVCRRPAGLVYVATTERLDTPLAGVTDVDADGIGDVVGGGHGDLDVLFGAPVGASPARLLHAGLPDAEGVTSAIAVAPIAPGEVVLAVPGVGVVGLVVAGGEGVTAPTTALFGIGARELGGVALVGPDRQAAVLSRTPTDPTAMIELVGDDQLLATAPACGGAPPLGAGSYLRSKRIGTWPTQVLVHAGDGAYCLRSFDGVGFGPPATFARPAEIAGAWPVQLDADRCVEIVLDLPGIVVGIADAVEATGCSHDAWAPAIWVGGERVIGTGDFDGDGRDELVMSSFDGTLATGPSGFEVQTRRELHAAVAADVNRDGRIDVVGGSAVEPDLTVLLGLSAGDYAAHRIPTTQPATWLGVGDLDGDTFADVCAVAPAGPTGAAVVVHYGSPTGLLPAQRIATTSAVRGIAVGRAFAPDVFDDVVVAHGAPGGAPPMLSLFAGTSRRAPYAPVVTDSTRPHAVIAGPSLVAGSGGPPDLAVFGEAELGAGPGLTSWWVPDLANLARHDLDPTILDASLSIRPLLAAGIEAGAPAVFVTRAEQAADSTGTKIGAVLLVVRARQDPAVAVSSQLEPEIVPLPDAVSHAPRVLRAVELDGDPASELLLAVDETSAGNVTRRRLYIVDRGAGARPPVAVEDLVGATACFDGATLALGPDPASPPALIVLCAGAAAGDGLFRIGDVDDPATVAPLALLPITGEASVLTGDVNGDAIGDLVVRVGASGFGAVHRVVQCSTSTAERCPPAGR